MRDDIQKHSGPVFLFIFLSTALIAPRSLNAQLLIDVDFGGAASTSEVGPAAVGQSPTDFWNYYTRNDGHGGWLTFGFLTNLNSAADVPTAVGLTIANAPGAWANGSADDMYNTYDYPFDGGNVTVTVTNLDSGAYDVYVYGIDSSYEITVNGFSYGQQVLAPLTVVNPVVWQEGVQYVVFRSVRITNAEPMTLTVRPGTGGYATISGMQIASVTATNYPPVAQSQNLALFQDSSQAITLTGFDPDGDRLTYSVVSTTAHGTLTGTPPNLLYTPAPGYSGTDSFSFTVSDGQLSSAPATVGLSVIGTSVPALLNVDFGGAASTTEKGPAATGHTVTDFWNYYTRNDGHGGWLTFGSLGNLKTAEGLPSAAGLTIANAPGAWGDGSSDDMYNTYDYPFDGGNVTVTVTNLDAAAYDFYVYGIDSRYELSVGGRSYGIKPLPNAPVVNPVVWQEGVQYVRFRSVLVTNAATVTLTVRPGAGGYATIAGMQIATVTPTNYPPVATDQKVSLLQDTSAPITLTGYDLDADTLSYVVATQPSHGSLSGTPPGLTYIPSPGFTGDDSFTFTANDGQTNSAPATVAISVVATNTSLLIDIDVGGGSSTSEVGPAATGHSLADFWNFYTRDDGKGGWLTFGSLTNLLTAEQISTSAGFTISNAPGSWGNGSADAMYNSYDYPLSGGNVTMAVTNLPAGSYDFYIYGLDSGYELSVDGFSYGTQSLPTNTVVNPVVWQEGLQYVLFHSVLVTNGQAATITVSPGTGGYATISGLQISGTMPINHPPRANSQSLLVGQDTQLPITLTGSDVDGNSLTFSVLTTPSHGSLSGAAPALTYTPTPGYSGSDSFTFKANDGSLDSAPGTIQINVFPSNTVTLIDVDFGGAAATGEVGPAATGHLASDYWNYYTRNDGHGGWLTFGSLTNLSTVEGVKTAAGLTITNAPGSWANGSADDMYNTYDYPLDGGNVTITVTNLDAGSYDFYIYGIDSTYELAVGAASYGDKTLPAGPVVNPVVWQEGLQYVLFHSVPVTNGDIVTITVRPGAGGYATVSGMQIGLEPAAAGPHSVALSIPAIFAPASVTLPAAAISSTSAILNASVNPRGAPTTVWFEWGTNSSFANTTPAQNLSGASSNLTVTAQVNSSLAPNSVYFFRVHASNPVGPTDGATLSFSRSSAAPAIETSILPAAGGAVALRFSGAAGQLYRVQASADLQHWVNIGTATETTSGSFQFNPPNSSGQPSRFYRLVSP